MYDLKFETTEEMVNQLREWREAYSLGYPLVPDDIFDHFKRELYTLEPDNDFLKEIDSPPKRNKEILPFTMGSLKNIFKDDIHNWVKKHSDKGGFVISHKLDGVAIETEWLNGKLKNAWTRGDGSVGENITEKALKFLPSEIVITDDLKDKSLYFSHEMLLTIDPTILGYKNKRNAVSGIIHRDDGLNLEHIKCIAHNWKNPFGKYENDEFERLCFIKSLSLDVVEHQMIKFPEEVVDIALNMLQQETDYDKDGIVFCPRLVQQENVKIPEFKIAFKLNKQIAKSKIKAIEWNVSRTYKIIPLIYIDPVDIGGVTIGKCTAFNAKFVKEKGIAIDSVIKVCRSGDVIPYIEEVISSPDNIILPGKCPVCSSVIEWDITKTHLNCMNKNCPAVVQKQIAHFFLSLGVEFFSEKMISSLNCNSISDVYKLTEEDILKIDGWGEISTKDFIKRLQESKNTTPAKLLAALGISNLGERTANVILDVYPLEKLILMSADVDFNTDKLCSIKGIGLKKAIIILNGIADNSSLLLELSQLGVSIDKAKGGPLENLKFEFTGSLSKPRKQTVAWIEEHGGRHSSIHNADYLVCNSESSSHKYTTAIKKDIPIITEEQLVQLYLKNKRG